MLRRISIAAVALCSLLLPSIASNTSAAPILIVADARDGVVRDNGVSGTAGIELVAGRAGDPFPPPDNSAVMFFELPGLASGQSILNANLKVTLNEINLLSASEQADLYGLGYVVTLPPENNIPDSWYFSGDLDTRTGNDLGTNIGSNSIVKIGDAFATTSTPTGDVNTDNAADTALTNFINQLYTQNGAQGGDFLALRLNANQFFQSTQFGGSFRRYRFFSSDNPDAATWPVLTLETSAAIPEPSSLILLGLTAAGYCGVCLRRRRKQRAA